MSCRSGIGMDVHPLVAGRALILGGVTVPHSRGLEGHSDGDVLIHVFSPEERDYYQLEEFWKEAIPLVQVQ